MYDIQWNKSYGGEGVIRQPGRIICNLCNVAQGTLLDETPQRSGLFKTWILLYLNQSHGKMIKDFQVKNWTSPRQT